MCLWCRDYNAVGFGFCDWCFPVAYLGAITSLAALILGFVIVLA